MRKLIVLLAAAMLAACNPTYNWRDYHSDGERYAVLFPAKPANQSRVVDLNGIKVEMAMTAAEVEGVTFAVGSAVLPDASLAGHAVDAMKTALVRNIGGTLVSDHDNTIEAKGKTMQLIGHFAYRDGRVYQAVVVGKAGEVQREAADTFLASFKLN
ncbi:hypothetical protein ACLB1G_11130 [Oxalobacteraceae bacterium A2-2]